MTFQPGIEEIRDLWWILQGPGLLDEAHPRFHERILTDAWFHDKWKECREEFEAWERTPEVLRTDVAARIGRSPLLGKYFEALASFWIRTCLRPEWFVSQVPLQSKATTQGGASRTLGELDFLFRLQKETLARHWEVAVKFYLCVAKTPAEARKPRFFVGTQTRDRLDLKISRLFDHQLRLLETPEGRDKLAEWKIAQVEARAWMKGMLFYPLHQNEFDWPLAEGVSAGHSRGWWSPIEGFRFPAIGEVDRSGIRYVLLPRARWLSPVRIISSTGELPGLSEAEAMMFCREHFSRHLSPLMWASLTISASSPDHSREWSEVDRGVVVHSQWEQAARGVAGLDEEP